MPDTDHIPSDPIQITITSRAGRLTQREQIQQTLDRARALGEPLRVRLPLTLYDRSKQRGYVDVRDATWNLQLPNGISVEMVEEFIATLGACIVAIANEGSERVLERLR